jgi:hypothetical protein
VVGVHRRQAKLARTLLILDEVHHVGEPVHGRRPAWARNVADLAGTVDADLHVAGVLNLSGTLWRSNKGERISTVRYARRVTVGSSRWSTTTSRLSSSSAPDSCAPSISTVSTAESSCRTWHSSNSSSPMADLDEAQSRATLRALGNSDEWRGAFVRALLDRLEDAHRSLDGHHVRA